MSIVKLCLVLFGVTLSCCEAYKVLVVFPMPGRSHSILGDGVVRHLAHDGHQVTYISAFPYEPESSNVRTIDVSDNMKFMPEDVINIDVIMQNKLEITSHAFVLYTFMKITRSTLENENVQNLIQDPKEQFDLVIAEWMFNELASGLAAVFDCPLVWFSSTDVHWSTLRLIDEASNPAYTGDALTTVIPPFSLWERASQLYIQFKVMFLKYAIFDVMERRAYDNLIAPSIMKRGREPPSYYDIKYNASLMLVNSHPSLSTAQSMPQNAIHIGGYHIEEVIQPLPEDLKKIMDSAEYGVIYFSMGSNLKSKHLSNELIDSFMYVFNELKQTVLWKFEEEIPNKPKNLHVLKWAPQQSILSHPNTVLFITHGGLLSMIEAIHYGKAFIGIPVFADHFTNVERAVRRGFAKKVDLAYSMAPKLKLAIEEMLSNPRYAERAKELSLIYHDHPVPPGKTLVYWVQHVVKTQGAPHLRSPALDVPFYQKLYLDLLLVILILLSVLILTLLRVRTVMSSKKKLNVKKKNK